jgi:hypothetical protein
VSLVNLTPNKNRCRWWRRWIYIDEGTIRTSREKAHCKSPFLAHQQSVFFILTRYIMVKIMHSYSEVVLRTTEHTMVYPGSDPSLEVIALRPVV